MRRSLLPVLLLSTLLGCRFERIKQMRAVAAMQEIERAAMESRPIPSVSTEAGYYGDYKTLVDYTHDHTARLQALNSRITELTGVEEGALKAASLTDPAARAANHAQLRQLVDGFGELVKEQDLLAGPGADAAIRAMPGDPDFKQGLLRELAGRREQLRFAMETYTRKQEYYRRIDALITRADEGIAGQDAAGKPLFRSAELAAAYNADLLSLRAYETSMNQDLQKLQQQQQALREESNR